MATPAPCCNLHVFVQALHLVSLESLRRNHTRLSQPPCRTTSVTMFALRTGTSYCALQGDRCICSDTYVRSSVDQRDSAASTRTQMRTISDYGSISGNSAMQNEIYHCGPIACGIYAMRLLNWESGIISTAGSGTAHVISIIGLRPYQAREKSTAPPSE